MRRYTTPTFTLTISGVDLSDGYDVYVTFRQGSTTLTKTDDDVVIAYDSDEDATTLAVYLDQLETAAFETKKDCRVQANWIDSSGTRTATKIKAIRIEGNLLESEVEYGD